MGFFSRSNSNGTPITCAFCNKELGLNRYLIKKTDSGKMLWKCPECAKKGGYMKVVGEKAYFCDKDGNILDTPDYNEEIRVKCDTCGYIYCYTQADIDENKRNANQDVRSSALSVMNAIGGTQLGAQANMAQADRAMSNVIDFSKCPNRY